MGPVGEIIYGGLEFELEPDQRPVGFLDEVADLVEGIGSDLSFRGAMEELAGFVWQEFGDEVTEQIRSMGLLPDDEWRVTHPLIPIWSP